MIVYVTDYYWTNIPLNENYLTCSLLYIELSQIEIKSGNFPSEQMSISFDDSKCIVSSRELALFRVGCVL